MTTTIAKIETLRVKANNAKGLKNKFYYLNKILKLEQEIKDFN